MNNDFSSYEDDDDDLDVAAMKERGSDPPAMNFNIQVYESSSDDKSNNV